MTKLIQVKFGSVQYIVEKRGDIRKAKVEIGRQTGSSNAADRKGAV